MWWTLLDIRRFWRGRRKRWCPCRPEWLRCRGMSFWEIYSWLRCWFGRLSSGRTLTLCSNWILTSFLSWTDMYCSFPQSFALAYRRTWAWCLRWWYCQSAHARPGIRLLPIPYCRLWLRSSCMSLGGRRRSRLFWVIIWCEGMKIWWQKLSRSVKSQRVCFSLLVIDIFIYVKYFYMHLKLIKFTINWTYQNQKECIFIYINVYIFMDFTWYISGFIDQIKHKNKKNTDKLSNFYFFLLFCLWT